MYFKVRKDPLKNYVRIFQSFQYWESGRLMLILTRKTISRNSKYFVLCSTFYWIFIHHSSYVSLFITLHMRHKFTNFDLLVFLFILLGIDLGLSKTLTVANTFCSLTIHILYNFAWLILYLYIKVWKAIHEKELTGNIVKSKLYKKLIIVDNFPIAVVPVNNDLKLCYAVLISYQSMILAKYYLSAMSKLWLLTDFVMQHAWKRFQSF